VGAMKGVILGIAPEGSDRRHFATAFHPSTSRKRRSFIHEACRYSPKAPSIVVVVDPGVGGARRPIAVSSNPSPEGERVPRSGG